VQTFLIFAIVVRRLLRWAGTARLMGDTRMRCLEKFDFISLLENVADMIRKIKREEHEVIAEEKYHVT